MRSEADALELLSNELLARKPAQRALALLGSWLNFEVGGASAAGVRDVRKCFKGHEVIRIYSAARNVPRVWRIPGRG
jgi:hypothetical protein